MPEKPRKIPYVIKECPRCGGKTLAIWRHVHNRLVCHKDQPCAVFDSLCSDPACDYPMPKGLREWCQKNGPEFLKEGEFASPEVARILSQEIEPLPAPFYRYEDEKPCEEGKPQEPSLRKGLRKLNFDPSRK